MGTLPLADVRVISLEQYGAGPFGTLHLADLGADVVKIEDPTVGGDVGRYVPPYTEGEDALFFESFNRGKRSISLDITTGAGRRVFHDLVRVSDVVYSNLRGDVPQKLGIRYADLADVNPRIVCCSLSGYGTTGPRRDEPAYDYMLQARCGWMDLTGEPGGPPTKSGLSLVDYSGGIVAALSVVAAVHAARRDGVGSDCDVSLFDTAISMLTYPATWHLTAGYTPERLAHSAHPSLVPFQAFRTSSGWMVVGCAKEKFWHRLLDVVGQPQWRDDERFRDFPARARHREVLVAELAEIFAQRPAESWLAELERAGVPCAPVNDVPAALQDPQVAARELLVDTEHPRWGTVRQVATAVRVDGWRGRAEPAPARNQHADEILGGLLRYDDGTRKALQAAGAFGAEESR